ncbi:MAG: hypothetical protein AAGF77_01685 [Bacteroidota bacterium]
MIKITTLVLAFIGLHGLAQQPTTIAQAGCIEIVTFTPQAGVSEAALQQAMEATNPIVKTFDGFIARYTSVNEKGVFLDVVYWENQEKAMKAAQKVSKLPEIARHFALIDPKSITMEHFEIFNRQ